MKIVNTTAVELYIGDLSRVDPQGKLGIKQGIRLQPTGDPGNLDERDGIPDWVYSQTTAIAALDLAGDLTVTFSAGAASGVVQSELDVVQGAVDAAVAVSVINDVTGAPYTLVLADAGKTLLVDSANDLTVPLNATVAFAVGTRIDLMSSSADATVVATGGVTINKHAVSQLLLNGTWSAATLVKTATDTWVLVGNLLPV